MPYDRLRNGAETACSGAVTVASDALPFLLGDAAKLHLTGQEEHETGQDRGGADLLSHKTLMPNQPLIEPVRERNLPRLNAKIALFSGNYNYHRDGSNQALNRLVAHLEKRGAEVLVFSPTVKEPAFPPQGRLISTPSVAIPTREEYRFPLGLPQKQQKMIADFGPDLFHVSSPDPLNHAAIKLAGKMGRPVVASVHTRFEAYLEYYHMKPLLAWGRRYLARFYRACAHVYAPSQSMADSLEADQIVRSARIWGRGVDSDIFSPSRRDLQWRAQLGIGPDEVTLGFAGRLVLEKGLDQFIRVIHQLQARGLKFRTMIIGDGPEKARLANALPDAVFTGFLTSEHLGRAFASADLFLFPSITETFGNVTLEAIAAGAPPVCANATGARSLVEHGVTGYLCDPDSDADFVDHIAKLIADPDLRSRMRVAGQIASKNYGWEAVLDRLVWQYLELIPHTKL